MTDLQKELEGLVKKWHDRSSTEGAASEVFEDADEAAWHEGKATQLSDCADELAAILARHDLAGLVRDAERYRWLRCNLNVTVSHWFCTDGGETLDAAIDAAMQGDSHD